jgi:hypothetical protein
MIVTPHISDSDTTGTDCLPITQAQAHKKPLHQTMVSGF